jgi:TRAP-type mannitol/chloroaromatic compound transport system permease small subunit
MKDIVKIIDTISEKIAKAFSYLTFVLVLTLTYEVIRRYIFNSPTQWSFDMTYFASSLFLVFGLAYTFSIGGHVSVDLITCKLSKRVSALIFVIFMLSLFFVSWGNIINALIPHVKQSWLLKERSMTGFMPPIYPYKTWLLAGIILLFIQGISEFLKKLYLLITGKELLKTGDEKQ